MYCSDLLVHASDDVISTDPETQEFDSTSLQRIEKVGLVNPLRKQHLLLNEINKLL